MKKILSIAATGILLASCHNAEKEAQATAAQRSLDSLQTEMVRQHTVDSMNAATTTATVPPVQADGMTTTTAPGKTVVTPAPVVATRSHHYNHRGYSSQTNNYYQQAPAVTQSPATTTYTEPAPQKRGWSAKAKGTLIGAGAGAVGGAVIGHGAKGAVIGGVLGAAAGLGTGAIIDHKNGR